MLGVTLSCCPLSPQHDVQAQLQHQQFARKQQVRISSYSVAPESSNPTEVSTVLLPSPHRLHGSRQLSMLQCRNGGTH